MAQGAFKQPAHSREKLLKVQVRRDQWRKNMSDRVYRIYGYHKSFKSMIHVIQSTFKPR